MAKLNWYASVNRSKNNQSGTMIRLKKDKHKNALMFIQQHFNRVEELLSSSPEQLPAFLLKNEDWERVTKGLKIGFSNKFMKIHYGDAEFCVVCHQEFKQDIMHTEYMRVEAEKQRKEKEEEE